VLITRASTIADFRGLQWGVPSKKWTTLTTDTLQPLKEKNPLRHADLSQTIRDAMQVSLNLGERYLWVDSLCIVQDDPVDPKRQIDTMDFIYSAAFITLIGAAGDHANSGLPGVSVLPRDSRRQTIKIQDIQVSNRMPPLKDLLRRSVWNTRGWTYQERMFSKRCIFFTTCQAYYFCPSGRIPEIHDRLPEVYTEAYDGLWSDKTEGLKLFTDNVLNYTHRNLTSQADIVRAFEGVMNHILSKGFGTSYHGLPEERFADALMWQPQEATKNRVAPITLPSWSWISASGTVKYTCRAKSSVAQLGPTCVLANRRGTSNIPDELACYLAKVRAYSDQYTRTDRDWK
jgi:hypothetical protein